MDNANELEGLRPEDIALPPMSQDELRQFGASMTGDAGQVELHDSEIMESMRILLYLQGKYSHRRADFANLSSMAGEATELFEKAGLQISVDWIGPALKVPPEPPQITIQGRLRPFDADRQRYDVSRGVAEQYWEQKRRGG